MLWCPACQTEAPPGKKFCRTCGGALQEKPVPAMEPAPTSFKCPSCQAEIAPHAKFCRFCGHTLKPAPAEVQTGAQRYIVPAPAPVIAPPAPTPYTLPEFEATPARRPNLPLLIGGGVLVAAVAAFAWYWTSTARERQFRQAVEKGRLVTPAGDNALELYQQIVREKGTSSSSARKMREIALPVLRSKSDELFRVWYSEADLGDTRWSDVQKLQDWLAEVNPHDPVVQARQAYAAGQVVIIAGRYGEALQHYQRALALQPEWPLALNGVGRACRNLRDMACAEDYYRRAASADPRWIFPRQNLGGVYLELNRLQEAESEYLAAINMDPNRAGSRFLLAQLYERARRKDDACQQYTTALRLAENLQRAPFDREVARQRAARVCR